MESDLKPCPFCGKDIIIVHSVEREDRPKCRWHTIVYCLFCFGQASTHGFHWTKKESEEVAIKAWNRRVTDGTAK